MKSEQWLKEASSKLQAAGIGSARLDCLILLEDCLQRDRSYILAHPETALGAVQIKKLNTHLGRRAKHEPLAYIRGFTEFYGRRFKVNKHVLEPRPESETMIDLLKEVAASHKTKASSKKNSSYGSGLKTQGFWIADIGTGCGAIGITAALELHNHKVDLYDIDANTLAVAKHNMAMHELHLKAFKQDLLNKPANEYEVILANLPYVPNNWKINEAAAMEPKIAIFGGKDGLDLYRRLFKQIESFKYRPKYVLTESLPPQHEKLAEIAADSGYRQIKAKDFIQLFISQ